jgi:hypothetical protein
MSAAVYFFIVTLLAIINGHGDDFVVTVCIISFLTSIYYGAKAIFIRRS